MNVLADRSEPDAKTSAARIEDRRLSRVRTAAWTLLSTAGLIEALAWRHTMQDDGVNYLDMGDAILRGDWKMALNGVWSPLYPFLQALALHLFRASPKLQFTVVHCVNFAIYIFALASFEFFLTSATAERPNAELSQNGTTPLPRWTVFLVGYAVFLWSSLQLITLQLVAPDMLMAGFLYLAMGLLLQILLCPANTSQFACLGVALGLGYLAKAPVFPLAFVFLFFLMFLAFRAQRAAIGILVAAVVFLGISAPWILALSHAKGRLIFGESAKFNYLVHVNEAGPDWYFQDLGTAGGHYLHPVRKLFDDPPVYEFATPLRGTSPITYDPSYWADGAMPRVLFKHELAVIKRYLTLYLDDFFSSQTPLFVGFVVLAWMYRTDDRFGQFTGRWQVWLIGLSGLAMYALVYAELRYVGVFFTLVWLGLYCGLRVGTGFEDRRLASLVAMSVAIAMAAPTLVSVTGYLRTVLKKQPNVQWQVALDLQTLGIKPGDRIARLPAHYGLGWERLLNVEEAAEVPMENALDFWCAKPETQARALDTLRPFHVVAFVAELAPPSKECAAPRGWKTVEDGMYYVMFLQGASAK